MTASSTDRVGSTRRRTGTNTSNTPLSRVSEDDDEFWRKSGPKRTSGSVLLSLAGIAASCCILSAVVLFSKPESTRIQEPLPMVRSVPQPQNDGKLVALIYPPGIMGGYRNQCIRLLSLVVYALQNEIPSILLPSMQWSTRVDDQVSSGPIPMDLLFDIDYWNTFYPKLPRFVDYQPNRYYDCWHVQDESSTLPANATELTRQVVSRGFLTPVYNLSRDIASRKVTPNLRQLDLLESVSHCRHPIAYGGGRMGGRLWRDYVELKGNIPFNAQALVLQALRPKQEWRNVAQKCVQQHASSNNYIALHARVELDMMVHRCGQGKERNFTKILNMVSDLSSFQTQPMDGVFVAVSRRGIEHQEEEPGYGKFKAFVDENVRTLNEAVQEGLQNGRLPVFECGRQAMHEHYYSLHQDTMDYGTTLQSMINFHVAVEASIFVGVRDSSYSTDIWMTRYHQGKGGANYEYTPNGIVLMENDGLPPLHGNCKK